MTTSQERVGEKIGNGLDGGRIESSLLARIYKMM